MCIAQQGPKAQPEQSGQRSSADEVQRTKQKPLGEGMIFSCVYNGGPVSMLSQST
jgi:hypothetical protein